MDGMQGIAIREPAGPLVARALGVRLARRGAADAAATAPAGEAQTPPPAAEVLPVSKPVGESGATVSSVSLHNSFLRMFLLETSHLPAQARQAAGDRLYGQDVSLRVMVLPGGAPLAVGGQARTLAEADDGATRVIRELAYVSFLRRFLVSSGGTGLGVGDRTMPPITRETDSPLDARQVLDDRQVLLRAERTPLAGLFRSAAPGALVPMMGALDRLAEALAPLAGEFARLTRPETFAPVRAASSAPLFVQVQAGPDAAPGSHRVEVVRAARGHRIASDAVAPGPMGLTGSFAVNGVTVPVAAADSLFDLVARINRGEDLNANGVLDPGEDTDGDFRLDGGTGAHGVRASFFEGRLELTMVGANAGEIALADPDGILQAVGLMALDANSQVTFPHELAGAQDALIRVDGREFRSADNTFTDAIPGVKLTLGGEPGEAVTVMLEADPSAAVAALAAALDRFNTAVRAMNGVLGSAGGILSRDPAATRLRSALVRALAAPVAGRPADLDEAADVGVERAARARAVFSETQLGAAARAARAAPPRPPQPLGAAEDPPSVYNALDELGIVAAEDDTFRLDRERFAAVLATRAPEVAGLFARAGEGIAARVIERVEAALGDSGELAMRRAALTELLAEHFGERFRRGFAPDPARLLLSALAAGRG